jgi:heme-degrading monooxygenase HmoA
MMQAATTPTPPYYAVIFTSFRTDGDNGYEEMAEKMVELARRQPGFLGVESVRDGLGITVSYWSSLEAISSWKENAEHKIAQKKGSAVWYRYFRVRIAKVEREYGFSSSAADK